MLRHALVRHKQKHLRRMRQAVSANNWVSQTVWQ